MHENYKIYIVFHRIIGKVFSLTQDPRQASGLDVSKTDPRGIARIRFFTLID